MKKTYLLSGKYILNVVKNWNDYSYKYVVIYKLQ